jgi:transposase
LYLALDLGNTTWTLAFTTGPAEPARVRTMPAADLVALDREIAAARARFHLPPEAPVRSCYEAGREGFWIHRALVARGIENLVVDSASIEVNRRKRRAKTDRLDAEALVALLVRHWEQQAQQALRAQRRRRRVRRVWSVVRVPSLEDEDRRHLHRELFLLTRERTRVVNRIKALLATHGVRLAHLRGLPAELPVIRTWDSQPLPSGAQARLRHEWSRLLFLRRQLRALVAERVRLQKTADDPAAHIARRLLALKGIGDVSAWLYATEFFSWRAFRNRREVAALAGLTPSPHQSGDRVQEQGISKAGNRHIRALAIELAWSWLRRQPQSALSRWYRHRFAGSGPRLRRVGIVALARKLLVALWRYVETDQLPAGAALKA